MNVAARITTKDAPDLSSFDWADPFLLAQQLTEDERLLRDAAATFAKETLQPRVIEAFRDVQAAEQDRDTKEKQAEAYANQKLAEARGQVAQILQEAEGYRAQVVNEAKGEAARFIAVHEEYQLAPEVTRKRLYLETMERVMGDVEKIIIDESAVGGGGGQGVVPYLPLNQLRQGGN